MLLKQRDLQMIGFPSRSKASNPIPLEALRGSRDKTCETQPNLDRDPYIPEPCPVNGGVQLYFGVEKATCFNWAKGIFQGALIESVTFMGFLHLCIGSLPL